MHCYLEPCDDIPALNEAKNLESPFPEALRTSSQDEVSSPGTPLNIALSFICVVIEAWLYIFARLLISADVLDDYSEPIVNGNDAAFEEAPHKTFTESAGNN